MNELSKNYNLEERTACFGELVICLCKKIPNDTISQPLIKQLVRSSTSIGANYMEANSASSRKDFKNKIFICKKETQETNHWIRMLLCCAPFYKTELDMLSQECRELTLIFGRIIASLNVSIKLLDHSTLIQNSNFKIKN